MKIYIDILLITNGIMTYIMLCALCRIVHQRVKPLRMFAASALGGLFSLVIVINSGGFFTALLIVLLKLTGIAATLLTAFGLGSFYSRLRYFLIYLAVSTLFTGAAVTIWQLSKSKVIFFRNLTVYFNISLLDLVLSTAAAYGLLTVYEIITRKSFNRAAKYEAVYENGGYVIKLPAVCDSGNRLCDNFTGTPVVVFYCDELFYHYDLDRDDPETLSGFRLIPFSTVNGGGLIHITAAGSVKIIDEKDNIRTLRCYVGIVPSKGKKSRAIFNPVLLS